MSKVYSFDFALVVLAITRMVSPPFSQAERKRPILPGGLPVLPTPYAPMHIRSPTGSPWASTTWPEITTPRDNAMEIPSSVSPEAMVT